MRMLMISLSLSLLCGCGEGYQQEGEQWCWVWWLGQDKYMEVLEDVDGELTVLSDENYAKTESNVYVKGEKLLGADPSTFEVIFGGFSRDKTHVFCGIFPLDVSEVKEFRFIDKRHAGPISGSVAGAESYYGSEYLKPFPDIQPDDRMVVADSLTTDGRSCWYGPALLEAADPETLMFAFASPAGGVYLKDKSHVYYNYQLIDGADPESIQPVYKRAGIDSEDKYRYYYRGQVVAERQTDQQDDTLPDDQ